MFKTRKKLTVAAETIRHLQAQALRGVVGGQTIARCSTDCSEAICPDTEFNQGCNGNTETCAPSIFCNTANCSAQC
jgi:hypothetical protein